MTGDWRRRLAAARAPATAEQVEWDALWQTLHDRLRGRGVAPNAAVKRADALMDLHNHGPRPEPKETQT